MGSKGRQTYEFKASLHSEVHDSQNSIARPHLRKKGKRYYAQDTPEEVKGKETEQ